MRPDRWARPLDEPLARRGTPVYLSECFLGGSGELLGDVGGSRSSSGGFVWLAGQNGDDCEVQDDDDDGRVCKPRNKLIWSFKLLVTV